MKSYESQNPAGIEDEENTACRECSQTKADFLCGCKFPLVPVCLQCAETHFKKQMSGSAHWKLPMQASLHIKSAERLHRAQNREAGLTTGRKKAQELVESVEICEQEVSLICNQLVQEVVQRKDALLAQLRVMTTAFLEEFSSAVQEVESNVYIEEYTPSPGIATALWRYSPQQVIELPQFYATYTKPDLSFPLQNLVDFNWTPIGIHPVVLDSSGQKSRLYQPVQALPMQYSPPSFNDVLYVQSAIRINLSRKAITREIEQMIDFPDPQDTGIELVSDTRTDPMSLLSSPASTTLSKLLPFQYQFSVQNVEIHPAKTLADGSIYIGQWKRCYNGVFRKGKGRFFSIQGWFSEGYWSGGRLHNLGRIVYANGDYYEGGLELGERSGQGKLEAFGKTMVYKGSWEKGEKNGNGEETFADGSKYTGEFKNGEKNGAGGLLWSDGSSYTGSFLNGEKHGQGVYLWADGRSYDGEWKGGKMNGRGKFTYADGMVYDGQYVDDKKEGYGVYRWDGNVYEGDWLAGKMHGIGYLTMNGHKKKSEFQNGNRIRDISD